MEKWRYNFGIGCIRMAQVGTEPLQTGGRAVMDPLPLKTVTYKQENILNRRMTLILRTNLLPFQYGLANEYRDS